MKKVLMVVGAICCAVSFSAWQEMPINGLGANFRIKKLNNREPIGYHRVRFYLGGGTMASPTMQYVYDGDTVTKPSDPSKNYCQFVRWTDSSGNEWDFNNNHIYSNTNIYAEYAWSDYTASVVNAVGSSSISSFLEYKYPYSYSWSEIDSGSITSVTGYGFDNIPSSNFPQTDLETGLTLSNSVSSYGGGCGPIAMIGVMFELASHHGYTNLMSMPINSNSRIDLATDIFNLVPTEELFGGTYTWPGQYTSSFNTYLSSHGYLSTIMAHNYGGFGYSSSFMSTALSIAKARINSGYPVTFYNAMEINGSGHLKNHYFNVFGYHTYQGYNRLGSLVQETLFNIRLNWPETETQINYAPLDFFRLNYSGLVYLQ
ncbi:MAG: InlB B-repeat-containing protein [Bacilli bacterium]|nr:InlB B-repeat-containing protein [Bacilli bacterium]